MTRKPDMDLARELAELALDAGRTILDVYASNFQVEAKSDASPVTEADQRAEDLILSGLQKKFPQVPVLAEEAAAKGEVPELGEKFFLVDPLDGTREFVGRNGEFTVNIALVEKTRPVAGVVLAPAIGDLYLASAQAGTVRLEAKGSRADLAGLSTATRLRTGAPEGALRAMASRSHRDEETNAFLKKLGVSETVSAGSSLKFCLLAAGEAEVYPRFGRTMEWDTGAGQAVLECAGGAVLTLDGEPLAYGKRERGFDNPAFIAWAKKPETK